MLVTFSGVYSEMAKNENATYYAISHLQEEALVCVDRRLGPIYNLVEGQLPAVGQNEGHTASLQIQTYWADQKNLVKDQR